MPINFICFHLSSLTVLIGEHYKKNPTVLQVWVFSVFFHSAQLENSDLLRQTSNAQHILYFLPDCKHLSAQGMLRCWLGEVREQQSPLAPWSVPRAACIGHRTTLQLFASTAHLDPVLTLPPALSQGRSWSSVVPYSAEENCHCSCFQEQRGTKFASCADLKLCLSRCIFKPVIFHTTLHYRQGLLKGVEWRVPNMHKICNYTYFSADLQSCSLLG